MVWLMPAVVVELVRVGKAIMAADQQRPHLLRAVQLLLQQQQLRRCLQGMALLPQAQRMILNGWMTMSCGAWG